MTLIAVLNPGPNPNPITNKRINKMNKNGFTQSN